MSSNEMTTAEAECDCGMPAFCDLLDIARDPPPGSGGAFTAIASGNWFDASTWEGGRIPNVADAFVTIPEGVAVIYNGVSDVPLAMVRVDGTLSFATNIDTRMTVDTLGVDEMGRLEIGTAANPIAGNVRADIVLHDSPFIDRVDYTLGDIDNDPTQLSLGIVSHGSVSIRGMEKTAQLKVATNPMAGSDTLTLSSVPTNWQVGDKILIVGTHFVPVPDNVDPLHVDETFRTQDEIFTITALNGSTVTLNGALKYDHDAPSAELKTSVANMTRNVEIRSAAPDDIATRGHTMFMSDDTDIEYAAFTDLGRTDKSRDLDDYQLDGPETEEDFRLKGSGADLFLETDPADVTNMRGRYALHIHKTGVTLAEDKAVVVKGNVVDGSPGWGIVQHDSIAQFDSNVTYGVFGSGFVAESGNENGSWKNNLAVKTAGRHMEAYDDVQIEKDQARNHDFGVTGTGFWFQGRYLAAVNNVAASSGGTGFFFLHRGIDNIDPMTEALPRPEIGNANPTVQVNQPPIDGFIGNESIADAMGLNIIGEEAPRLENDARNMIQGFTAWEFGVHGAHIQYSAHYTFKALKLFGTTGDTRELESGLLIGTSTEDVVVNGATIANVPTAIFTRDNFTDATQIALFGEIDQARVDKITDYGHRFVDITFGANVAKRFEGRLAAAGSTFKPIKYTAQNSANLPNLPLKLTLDDSSLKAVWADANGALVQAATITGTKEDSLGRISYPQLSELIQLDLDSVNNLLTQVGYFTAANGKRVILANTVYSDRLTGESKILTYTVELAHDWVLPAGAHDLGALPDITLVKYSTLLIRGNNPIIAIPGTNEIYYAGGLRDAALADATYVRGTVNHERLTGSAAAELVTAWGGNDTVDGGGGNDTLLGNDGNDSLLGGDGNDRLFGGDGADSLSGGNGDDIVLGDAGNDTVNGDAGSDTLSGGDGNDMLTGDADEIVGGADNLSGGAGQDTLNGAAGNDTLDGDDGNDSLLGGNGNDLLFGGIGHDTIFGGAGDDRVFAEDGNDVVDGGAGNDSLDGGAGVDLVSFAAATAGVNASLRTGVATGAGNDTLVGFEQIEGSSFNDTLQGDALNNALFGGTGDDLLDGGEGSDTLDGGDGFDIASFAGAGGFVNVSLRLQGAGQGTRAAGNTTLRNIEGLEGSAFDDLLTGDGNANRLSGRAGADRLVANGGADTLDGGDGMDTADFTGAAAAQVFSLNAANVGTFSGGGVLTSIEDIEASAFDDRFTSDAGGHMFDGNGGNDTVEGGGGADTLDGGDGIDTLSYATAGAGVHASVAARTAAVTGVAGTAWIGAFEVLVGSNFADTLSGGANADTVRGGGGGDNLTGGAGDDLLEGGAGDDVLNGGDGSDTLDGGDGFDRVVFSGAASGVVVSLASTASQSTPMGPVTLRNVEAIIGSARDDAFTGNALANALDGGGGNDLLIGAEGNDSLIGGSGNDTLDGGIGNDLLDGGDGIDTVSYANATAAVVASTLAELASGGAGTDTLLGIEVLEGSAFNDTLIGDDGVDTLRGGGGDDWLEGGSGNDSLDGGAGIDTASYANAGAAVAVSLAVAGAQNTRAAGSDSLVGIEVLVGSAFNDTLGGDAGDNTLRGGLGADLLDGGAGNDLLDGGAGYDTVQLGDTGVVVSMIGNGGSGSGKTLVDIEAVIGGGGNDRLTSDAAAHALYGGAGNDTIAGGGGADTLDGGDGIDTVTYEAAAGAVTVSLALRDAQATGPDGSDILTGFEVLVGSAFGDALTGSSANDTLRGGGGKDTLIGGAGNDQLEGGDGDDWLNGTSGNDTLLGGNGIDTAAFSGTTGVSVSLALAGQVQNTGAGLLLLDGIEALVGTAKDDTLIGSAGANTLVGGTGNDVLDGGAGADAIDGGDGIDTVTYAAATAAVNVALQTGIVQGGGGADTLTGVEIIEGSAFDDTLAGNDGMETLRGGAGNDWIAGSLGNDVMDGGAGIDTASYANAGAAVAVSLAISGGQNTRGAGTDTVLGFEILEGSAYHDTLTGAAGAETLRGGAGDDTLDGGAGNDLLDGGSGFDVISYANSGAGGVTVTLTADWRGVVSGIGGVDSLISIEGVIGSNGGDVLTSIGGSHLLNGGGGNDTLAGGPASDTLIGGDGIDTATYASASSAVVVSLATGTATGAGGVDSLSGIEVVIGSNFADSLSGGSADDTLRGGGGNDTLTGAAGNDSLDGGDGDDLLVGAGNGNDTLAGGAGFDTVSFFGSTVGLNVTIQGGAQAIAAGVSVTLTDIEALVGSSRDDRLTGNSAANALNGGSGNDTLTGGGGNDTLEGGQGSDLLVGGTGNDVFVFGAGAGSDVIQDFAQGDVVLFQGFGPAFDTFAEIFAVARASGADTFVRLTNPDGNGNVTVTFQGLALSALDANDFLFA